MATPDVLVALTRLARLRLASIAYETKRSRASFVRRRWLCGWKNYDQHEAAQKEFAAAEEALRLALRAYLEGPV